MSLKQQVLHGVAAAACLLLVSCDFGGGGAADLRNPSVADLDAADVRWGLPPRKDKGAPKRSYQYNMDAPGADGGAPAASAPVAAAPPAAAAVQAPANPIPAAPDPQIDVNKLR